MTETPVLICGGGLVGLSTAVLLAGRGVRPLVVERHPGTSLLPKGRGLNVRSMEIYGAAGLAGALAAAPQSVLTRCTEVIRARDLCAPVESRSARQAPGNLAGLSPAKPLMVD
ncbi:monooxygenase, partial [Streptomyces sp. SID11233]|nr:monooxygenase [Streptomyces sp. SID11233]